MLGLDAPTEDLAQAFRLAARMPRVRGFAVGRTIFAGPAQAWLAGRIGDAEAVETMAHSFSGLVAAWRAARVGAPA